MKRTKFMRHLNRHGCTVLREGGKHAIVFNSANGQQSAVPRHPEIKPSLLRKICRDLDIPKPTEKELLTKISRYGRGFELKEVTAQ